MKARRLTIVALAAAVCGCSLEADLASDGRSLALSDHGKLGVRSADGADVELGFGIDPKWSHSSRFVAYTGDRLQLTVSSRLGGSPRVSPWPVHGAIAWSPSDDRIAFVESDDGVESVRVVEVGSWRTVALRHLEPDADAHALDWSPDGGELLVSDSRYVRTILRRRAELAVGGARVSAAWRSAGRVRVLKVAEDDPTTVTTLDWDPAGNRIEVVARRSIAGWIPRERTADGAYEIGPISPDGRRFSCFAVGDRSSDRALRRFNGTTDPAVRQRLCERIRVEGRALIFDASSSESAPQSIPLDGVLDDRWTGRQVESRWTGNQAVRTFELDPISELGATSWSPDGSRFSFATSRRFRVWTIGN